ncbi:hypothetical protein E2562_026841 [Oryza meyeriana var. granulata]|uniref:Uncharacterized protein n=1 Tax=Oryza meyeriana var. granulata TaxID=110450 RepID=A0A6G1CK21_9ORYZ|nr:hypothetical protein E2562_026841 [Oryza meyeriana var. granulata]
MRNPRPLLSIVAAGVRCAPEATPPSSAHGRRSPWVAGTHAQASLPPPLHPAEPTTASSGHRSSPVSASVPRPLATAAGLLPLR